MTEHSMLIVEDDENLAELTRDFFEQFEFNCSIEGNGEKALARALDEQPDVILLDIMLPDLDGIQICKQIRDKVASKIVMLTARTDTIDQVLGLEMGADDYLAKPFELDELRARLHALLRRTQGYAGQTLTVGELSFDGVNRSFYFRSEPLPLSKRESALLEVLVGRAGRAVSKEYLFEQVFGLEDDVNPEAVELIVFRLRKKLKDTNVAITTLRGLGYLLDVARDNH